MGKRIILTFVLLSILLFPFEIAQAQSEDQYPIYIVQAGDTLNLIAQKFGVPVRDLISANNLSDPNSLGIGDRLIIPGLEGIHGILAADVVPLGFDLRSLSIGYQIPISMLGRLNRVTSPSEIFAGANLILPQSNDSNRLEQIGQINPGQSLLEAAISARLNPWSLASSNLIDNSSVLIAGDGLFYPASPDAPEAFAGSALVTKIEANPLPLKQGGTVVLRVYTREPAAVSGKLGSYVLAFQPENDNQYVALQGIYALADPGLTSLSLKAVGASGDVYEFEESLLLKSGNYPQDPPLTVDPKTIDPQYTKPEDDEVANTTRPVTSTRYWTKLFRPPVDEPICIKSWFGNRRSYNGGPYIYFHTGLDYGVCANLNIYAPAPGKVVFVGPLTVRGNATIIDHGWGVYSGFWHQSKINVKVGDMVQAGDIIGEIGSTGRVTGPHLHWEVWVNGIQVDPLDWLDNLYP
jgi:murein DD-endopeptidase MepM/ murein hydrolase activator NlpD